MVPTTAEELTPCPRTVKYPEVSGTESHRQLQEEYNEKTLPNHMFPVKAFRQKPDEEKNAFQT